MNKINLRAIARNLEISPATLYRVINNADNVAPCTRQKVLGELRRQGFFTAERSQNRNILFDLSHNYIRENIGNELMRRLLEKNYNCQVISLKKMSSEIIRSIEKSSVIILCDLPTEQEILRIKEINPDITVINIFGGNLGDVSINPDDWSGGALAANYLYENGHRHVAVFSRMEEPNHLVRMKSFFVEMSFLSPKAKIDQVKVSTLGEKLQEYTDYFLLNRNLPTAVFFTSIMLVNYFCSFAAKYKPELLEQLSLLSYDLPSPEQPVFYNIDRIYYSFESVLFWAEYYIMNYPVLLHPEPNQIRISVKLQKNGGVKKYSGLAFPECFQTDSVAGYPGLEVLQDQWEIM